MKKIIAIIRDECVERSRSALECFGIHEITAVQVSQVALHSCGISPPDPKNSLQPETPSCPAEQQGGLPGGTGTENSERSGNECEPGFLPRTMLMMIVIDEAVFPVVRTLIQVNRSGPGRDGEIFVCPMVTVMEI